jgi:hypothetical protein
MDSPFNRSISRAARCSHGELTYAKLEGPVRSTSDVQHADSEFSAQRLCAFVASIVTSSAQHNSYICSSNGAPADINDCTTF